MPKSIRTIKELLCTPFTQEEFNDFKSKLIETTNETNKRLHKNIKIISVELTNESLITIKTNSDVIWNIVKDEYQGEDDYVLLHEIKHDGSYHIQARREYFQYIIDSLVTHEYSNKKAFAYDRMNNIINLIAEANKKSDIKNKKGKNQGKKSEYVRHGYLDYQNNQWNQEIIYI